MSTTPSHEHYDVIVVGAGFAGLTAGALLAAAGQRVLVLERSAQGAGGYAHAFRRGGYVFDPAMHFNLQGGPGGLFDMVYRHIGVRDRTEQIVVDHAYGVTFPDFELRHIPVGLDAFVDAHADAFPRHRDEIARFVRLCDQMHHDIHELTMSIDLRRLDAAVEEYPVFFKYRNLTVRAVLDEYISDDRLKAVLAASCWYAGLPPSKLSFFPYTQILMNQQEGNFYPRGSFQAMVDDLVRGLEGNGGELVLGAEVTRIVVEDGKVAGVRTADGAEFRAPTVVSNVDGRVTFERLLEPEEVPSGLMRRIGRLKPGVSAFIVFAATSAPLQHLGGEHETFVNRTWSHEEQFDAVHRGEVGGMWLAVPTLADPLLAPAGHHSVIITSHAIMDAPTPWAELRETLKEQLLDEAERLYPGFRSGLVFTETATPHTLERYTGNIGGAAYGWAQTPQQVGTKRLPQRTGLEGLYLAGHWSQPGPGCIRVLTSGIHTSALILADKGLPGSLVPSFEEANLPSLT